MKKENDKKLELLRFQSGIMDFQNNQYDILYDDLFVEDLIKYLFRLSRNGYIEVATRVLQKLGDYIREGEPSCRDKSRYILSSFTEGIGGDEFKEFSHVITQLNSS